MKLIKPILVLIAVVNAMALNAQLSVNATVRHASPSSTTSVGNISLTVSGGTGPYTYSWSNGATTQNINSVARNNYTVSVTDFTTGTISYPYGLGYKTKWNTQYDLVSRNDSLFGQGEGVTKNTLRRHTNGWAEIVLHSVSGQFLFGFTDSLSTAKNDVNAIDFGYTLYSGAIFAYAGGYSSALATANPGDVLRIERVNTDYNLLLNGSVIFTSTADSSKACKLKVFNYIDGVDNVGCSFIDSTGFNFPNYVTVKPLIKHSTAANIKDGSISITPRYYTMAPVTCTWSAGGLSYTGTALPDLTNGSYSVTVADALNNTSNYIYDVLYKARLDSLQGCDFTNDSLIAQNTYTQSWATAVNNYVLAGGQDGEIQWVLPDSVTYAMMGFASAISYTPGDYTDIENGIYLQDKYLYLASNGSFYILNYDCYPGDILKLKRTGSAIDIRLNGTSLFTYTVANAGVDWSIKTIINIATPGDYINDLGLSGPGFAIEGPPPYSHNADINLNWHLEETFDENGTVISSEKNYMDNLGRSTQHLVKNATNEVFTSQTVYDGYGRAAISTMPAFTGNSLTYQNWFMRTANGQVYDYPHFDTPATLNSPVLPETTMSNVLGNYYSDNNTYDAYQATAGNPYTRVEYSGDPGSTQRRVSQPGNNFKMGSGHESYSFSMVCGDELKNVFGGSYYYKCKRDSSDYNKPTILTTANAITATKEIVMTPDNIETVTYRIGDKVIATGFAGLSAGESCTFTSVKSTMVYNGTQGADIHLPDNNKGSLVLSMPVQATTPATTVTSYTNVVFGITDLYTDIKLTSGTDYTLNTGTGQVTFSSGFLSQYTGRSLMLRISFAYLSAYENSLLAAGVTPADINAVYTLHYGRFSKNFYDIGGALRASVSPKGFGCSLPNVITMFTSYDYDHHGQVIAKTTPDEGLVEMAYDTEGRLRFTQNAEQKLNNRFSYVNYDKHSRPYETGEYQSSNSSGVAWFTNYYLSGPPPLYSGIPTYSIIDQQDGLTTAQKTNTTITGYTNPAGGSNDIPNTYTYYSQYQNFRNGAVNFIKNKNSTVWMNYDKVGRKTSTITQITEADFVAKTPNIDARIKTTESTYNFYNGITSSYTWQPNNSNEICKYAYTYNANYQNTLTTIAYGTVTAQNLSASFYNKMGKLNRVVTGTNYQGTDLVYTLNGGLKAINHPGLDSGLDPGSDNGDYTGAHPTHVNRDIFGEIVEYYNNDYERSGSNIVSSISAPASKYNGLVYATRFKTVNAVNSHTTGTNYIDYMGLNTAVITTTNYAEQELAFTYTYDQFNQLATSTFNTYNNNSNTYSARAEYAETGAAGADIGYDRNGNITRLVRQAYNSNVLDNLTYTVGTNNNQLSNILDAATYTLPANFKTSSTVTPSAFSYNSIGQLTVSAAEGVDSITYYPDGKVKRIKFNNSNYSLYEYGAGGEKLKSKYYDNAANKIKYTWYIGPVIYEWDEAGANTFNIAEVNIPGGLLRVNAQATTGISSGYLVFKVTDHLGNVRATYKGNGTGNGIDILSANDYYAFGGQLPGRSYTFEDYRYGYQGQEKATAGNPWYTFDLRMYNQDIGRWFAPDPYGQFSSPYIGMANNPVRFTDPNGGWISVSAMGGAGAKAREVRRELHQDEFSYEEMKKRYDKELEHIAEHYLEDSNYDPAAYFAAVQALNNSYSGLGLDGGWLSGGREYITQNEAVLHQDEVQATNRTAPGSHGAPGLAVNDAWSGQYEMVWTTNGYAAMNNERMEITGQAQEARDAMAALAAGFNNAITANRAMNSSTGFDQAMAAAEDNTFQFSGGITLPEVTVFTDGKGSFGAPSYDIHAEVQNNLDAISNGFAYFPPPRTLPGFPGAERDKPKGGRPRWKLPNGDIGEWDGQHGEVEVYNPRGKHKGVWNPDGKPIKPPVPGRKVEPYFNPPSYNWRTPAGPWWMLGVAAGAAIIWEGSRFIIPARNLIPGP